MYNLGGDCGDDSGFPQSHLDLNQRHGSREENSRSEMESIRAPWKESSQEDINATIFSPCASCLKPITEWQDHVGTW